MTDLIRYCTRVKHFPSTSPRAIRMRAMRAYKAMKANEENVGLEIQSDDVEGNIPVDNVERSFETGINSPSTYHSLRTESSTETSYMDVEDNAEFRRKLADWASTVPQTQVTSLLSILHSVRSISELHSLPNDATSLLHTPARNVVAKSAATRRFCVVAFTDDGQIDIIPSNWIEKNSKGKCWWPTGITPEKRQRYVRKCKMPDDSFVKVNYDMIKQCDTYDKASEKLAKVSRGKQLKKNQSFSGNISAPQASTSGDNAFDFDSNELVYDSDVMTQQLPIPTVAPLTSEETKEKLADMLRWHQEENRRHQEENRRHHEMLFQFHESLNQIRMAITYNQAAAGRRSVSTASTFGFPLSTPAQVSKIETKIVNNAEFESDVMTYLSSIGGMTAKESMDRCLSEVFHVRIGKFYTWEGRSLTAKRDARKPMKSLHIIQCIFDTVTDETLKFKELRVKEWLRHCPQRIEAEKRREEKNS